MPIPEKPKQTRKRRRKFPQDALLIKPAAGKLYSDVLKTISTTQVLIVEAKLKPLRPTGKGEIFNQVGGTNVSDDPLISALREAVGNIGEIKNLESKATVRILDLNSGNNSEQVAGAIRISLPSYKGELKVTLSHPNAHEQVTAFAAMDARQAAKLIERKVLQVGPFSCSLRICDRVLRCFRCLGFGHPARFCYGIQRLTLVSNVEVKDIKAPTAR